MQHTGIRVSQQTHSSLLNSAKAGTNKKSSYKKPEKPVVNTEVQETVAI